METEESNQNLKPSTGETISRSGLLNKIDEYVKRTVGERNYFAFFYQGFLLTLFKSMPTIFGTFLRGKIFRSIMGGMGNNNLIEKNVTFNITKRIFIGDRVVIGESSVIDPRGISGKITIKNDVHIQRWCRLTTDGEDDISGELIIEDNVYVGPYSYFHAMGKITISKNCLFGPRITIIAGNHHYQNKEIPIRFQGGIPKDILIDEDVWLSANVTVLGGVTIGKGAVIGAGSVVTKDIPPYGIAVGAPARVIGKRE